jgi:hypothetical protein
VSYMSGVCELNGSTKGHKVWTHFLLALLIIILVI